MVKSPLIYAWRESIFSNDEKMAKPTTFSAPFLHYSLPPDTKIPRPRICFRLRTTDPDNQYELYYRSCVDGLYMLEGVDFTVSYALVAGILSLKIITAIASA